MVPGEQAGTGRAAWPDRGGGAAGTGDRPVETPAELDDATLVARARDRDTRAFEELLRRYQPAMFGLALRMLADRGDAEDVVQEVFVTAWRKLPQLRADAAFVGWLYRSTTNRCLNALRGRRETAQLDVEVLAEPHPGRRPEHAAEVGAGMRALAGALAGLAPAQRACWLLREVHGLSYAEIADVVDTTETAVRGRIARARAQLAEVMAPWR